MSTFEDSSGQPLPLPISPRDFNFLIVTPALALLPKRMDSPEARVMLTAIAQQESGLRHRWQVLDGGGKGPARGLLQFERGTRASRGGVWGVYLHSASAELLRELCRARDCRFDPADIWAQIERDDVLAAGIARLLLWTDPKPLPPVTDAQDGWDYYINTWRPGKPHRHTWDACHAKAVAAVLKP